MFSGITSWSLDEEQVEVCRERSLLYKSKGRDHVPSTSKNTGLTGLYKKFLFMPTMAISKLVFQEVIIPLTFIKEWAFLMSETTNRSLWADGLMRKVPGIHPCKLAERKWGQSRWRIRCSPWPSGSGHNLYQLGRNRRRQPDWKSI